MSALACAALLSPLLAPSLGSPAEQAGCLGLGLEMAGRYEKSFPAGGLDRQLSLPRALASLGLSQGPVGARLVLGAVRSGGEDGYVGVDGEALVPRVEVAEARYRLAPAGLSVAAGLVDDPWVGTGNLLWMHRALAPGLAEDQGWNERSDLGGLASWTAPASWLTATASWTTGEGLTRRERNNGQNLSGLVILRPLAGLNEDANPDRLALSLYARDGSRGLALARDHRAGLRVSGGYGPVLGGAELLKTWGVQADAARQPAGLSAWVAAAPTSPLVAYGRIDWINEAPKTKGDLTRVLRGALGLRLPTTRPASGVAPGRLSLVLEQRQVDAGVASLAGALAPRSASRIGLQLDMNLQGAVSTQALDPNASGSL